MLYFKFNYNINIEKTPQLHKSNLLFSVSYGTFLFLLLILFIWILNKIYNLGRAFPSDIDSVDTWYIEFDDQEYNVAIREVGLDKDGRYAVIAPYKDYLGFWCDEDFNFDFYNTIVGVEEISKEQFEQVWNAFSEDNTTHGKKRKNK